MKKILLLLLLFSYTTGYSQFNLKKLKKAKTSVEKEVKSATSKAKKPNQTKNMSSQFSQSPCSSAYKSLTKYLQKLEDKKAVNQVSSSSYKSYITTAERYLKSIKSKCPGLDISNEENQLNSYKSDLNSQGSSDDKRQSAIRKGYYDKAINNLVADTHPAYNNYYRAKVDLLTKAFEHYRHSKPTRSFQSLNEAKDAFNKIKSEHNDLDLSLIDSEINRLEGLLNSESGAEISSTLKKENDANYFRNIHMKLAYFYSDTSHGADATQGLQFTSTHKKLYETQAFFKDFTKADYLSKVATSKSSGTYPRAQFYVEQVVNALNDYSNFINKSGSSFHAYLDQLNNIGIKGDTQKELKELEATKVFCELLLKFAPNNNKASQWLKQVESQISKMQGSIVYASAMHKKYLSQILFSNREVAIGNETETDFSTRFKSGDYIYATVYLPSKLRKLTDSYAANDMEVKINEMPVAEASYTSIWVTTPMQDKNYLQFAILPDNAWKQRNGKPYVENKLRTHEAIAEQLLKAGSYSDVTVDIRVIFRGTGSSIKGGFTIDQSGGVDQLKSIVSREENDRLSDAKLPKAGMSNSNLKNQALTIMRNKSKGSGKTYTKAIITSVNWDYDKNWKGVTVSRSIVVALVSKEHDGKCMYQYFNFKQQERGNGTYNDNLEFAGAGDNVYISCDNAN